MKTGTQKYIEIYLIKALAKFQAYMKIKGTQDKYGKEKGRRFRKGILKNEKWYQVNEKGHYKQK